MREDTSPGINSLYALHRSLTFGSRVDDSRRGGDIDLLVRTTSAKKGILDRVRMASRIKSLIGDQKIDIIGDYEDNQVVQEVLKNGILLAI